jgi:hypothetical protein
LIATGIGIAIRPQSPAVLGTATLAGLIGLVAMEWDSARLMIGLLTSVAGLATLLMLCPSVVRRVVVSLIILFHFGGILTAVTSVPPRPWLSLWAWVHAYRPYLEFMYLNNAYHFYAPEPGPATLVWFYVKYEDGSAQWFKIPRREDHALAVEYQRRLSLTESVNQVSMPGDIPQVLFQAKQERRLLAGNRDAIIYHPEMDWRMQYREPNLFSKKMLEAYARHVARTTPHPMDKSIDVKSVKIYRVVHWIPSAKEIADGKDPEDPTLYLPYYQGEFSPDGHLLNPNDPYLYWLIPILKGRGSTLIASEHPGMFRTGVGFSKQQNQEKHDEIMNLLDVHVKLPTEVPADQVPVFPPRATNEGRE